MCVATYAVTHVHNMYSVASKDQSAHVNMSYICAYSAESFEADDSIYQDMSRRVKESMEHV